MADERQMPPADPADVPQVESLLTQTLEAQARRVEPPADALARVQTRLDAARPARQPRMGTIRWALAGAAALLLLLLVSPVGRATAAGIGHAARNVILTVRDAVTGNNGGAPTPVRGTSATGTGVPGSATTGSGSATAHTGGTVTGTIAATAGSGTAAGTPRSSGTRAATAASTTTATGTPASMPSPLLPTATTPTTATPVSPSARASPPP